MKLFIRLLTLVVTVFGASAAYAAWPADVTPIEAKNGATVKGNLAKGKTIALEWAWNSSMACFTQPLSSNFQANHVFYSTSIPPKSKMKLTVTPADGKTEFTIYAYMIGENNFAVPPGVPSATTCEAGPDSGKPNKEKPSRSVKLNNPKTGNAFNVLIGISGAKGVTGDYTVAMTLEK